MNQNEERKVEGKIAFWTREVREEPNMMTGEMVYNLGFKMVDNEEWHNVYAVDKEALVKLKESAPNGSTVSFFETKTPGAKRWNFKHGTFVVLEKSSGTGSSWNKKPRDFESREEREFKNMCVIAEFSIGQAINLVNNGKISLKDWPAMADAIERRVFTVKDRLKNNTSEEDLDDGESA
jgi:hypothetical protein